MICLGKSLIHAIAQYASDEIEKKALLELAAESGQAKYTSWVKDQSLILLEILEAYPSCKPPLGHMLELLPRLMPRYYSISSSLSVCILVSSEQLW